jgi:hypothetical protein
MNVFIANEQKKALPRDLIQKGSAVRKKKKIRLCEWSRCHPDF